MTLVSPRAIRLTLQARLSLWSAGLLVASSLTLGIVLLLGLRTIAVHIPEAQVCTSGDRNAHICPPGTASPAASLPVTVSLPDALATLRDLGPVTIVAAAAVVVLGSLLTYSVAGLALRPLRDVGRAAQAIDVDRLDHRLSTDRANDELLDITVRFNDMLDRLGEGLARERRFITDVSHELRTPLTAVRANLDVVRADSSASLADYRAAADAAERSLDRLERLVENLLLLATGRPSRPGARVRVAPLLEDVIASMRDTADHRSIGVTLRVEDDPIVGMDEPLLYRVAGNLVDNAIAYNRDGGSIAVVAARAEQNVMLAVSDTGVGIPPGDLPFVFDRLWRGDPSRTRKSGGAGLGLALVREIVSRHGGQVTAESELMQGSRFTVILPAVD